MHMDRSLGRPFASCCSCCLSIRPSCVSSSWRGCWNCSAHARHLKRPGQSFLLPRSPQPHSIVQCEGASSQHTSETTSIMVAVFAFRVSAFKCAFSLAATMSLHFKFPSLVWACLPRATITSSLPGTKSHASGVMMSKPRGIFLLTLLPSSAVEVKISSLFLICKELFGEVDWAIFVIFGWDCSALFALAL